MQGVCKVNAIVLNIFEYLRKGSSFLNNAYEERDLEF